MTDDVRSSMKKLEREAARVLGMLPPVSLAPAALDRIRRAVVAEAARQARTFDRFGFARLRAVVSSAAAVGLAALFTFNGPHAPIGETRGDAAESIDSWLAAAADSGNRVSRILEEADADTMTDDGAEPLDGLSDSFLSISGA